MKVSVIMPVLNEGPGLRDALTALRASALPEPLEIVVADGGPGASSGTLGADRFVRSGTGRARQMHAGALAASGDLLLFLHADNRLPAGWHTALTDVWSRTPPPACTAFTLTFDRPERVYRWIERSAAARFRLTHVPHGDQAIAVSRETYFAAGGFPDVPLMEEYCLMRRLKPYGPIRILPMAAVTSARRYVKNGPLRNALRNTLLVSLYYLGIRPERLAKMYR